MKHAQRVASARVRRAVRGIVRWTYLGGNMTQTYPQGAGLLPDGLT